MKKKLVEISILFFNYVNKKQLEKHKKRMAELIDEISETINSKRNSVDDYEMQYLRLKYPKKTEE